jgi:hypothetical protein
MDPRHRLPDLHHYVPNIWLYCTILDEPLLTVFTIASSNNTWVDALRSRSADLATKPDFANVCWKLLSKTVSPHDDPVGPELARRDVLGTFDPMTRQLVPYLTGRATPTNQNSRDICFYLIVFRDSKPGQFFTFRPSMHFLFDLIGIDKAFQAVGPEVLSLFPDPPVDFIRGLQFEPKTVISIFAYPIFYSNFDFCRSLQSKFCLENEWPKPFHGSVDLSFANTALESKKHFFDVYAAAFVDYLVIGDFHEMPPHLTIFQVMVPYLLIANQAILYSDIDNGVQLFAKELSESLVDQTLQRMKNDRELLQMICFITTEELLPKVLISKSLPFLLQYALGNPQILEYSSLKFFSIRDSDSEVDFNFMRCYRMFRAFFACFRIPSKLLRQSIDTIKGLIEAITNKAWRSEILFDLFSCVFVRKDEKWVCHPYVARKVIQMIDSMIVSPYIRGALAMFQAKKPTKTDVSSLDVYFQKSHLPIYQAVENHKWDVASQLSTYLPYYRRLYLRAHAMSCVLNGAPVPDDLKGVKIGGDIALVTQDRSMEFDTVVQGIVAKRESSDEALHWFPDIQKWNIIQELSVAIEQAPYEALASKTVSGQLAQLAFAKGLSRYLRHVIFYFHCVSTCQHGVPERLSDLFVLNITQALAGLVNANLVEKAARLSANDHLDLFQKAVFNLNVLSAVPEPSIAISISTHSNVPC